MPENNKELLLKLRRETRDPDGDHHSYKRRVDWYKEGDVTKQELIYIYILQEGKCFYCDVPVEEPRFNPTDIRGFDHIYPREKGGKHTLSNLVLCCGSCNEQKGGYKQHPQEEVEV